jgi:hypothetical protein
VDGQFEEKSLFPDVNEGSVDAKEWVYDPLSMLQRLFFGVF